jgi:2-methylcitrate dehydratase PrpD
MSAQPADLAFAFAAHVCSRRYEDLPAADLERTRALILDTVAAGIAGSSAEGIAAGLDYVRAAGGAGEAGVLVFGDRLPAGSAAFLNGTLFQARDFDPVYEPGVMLPYGPVVAAALAAGQLAGASGRELLAAIVLGTDLACRIGRALTGGLGWSRSATLGVFGAAAAAARLLRLDLERTVHALGLALSQSAGNIQTVIDGSLAKRFQGGFAAEAGVKAARLALLGVTGPVNVFEGRFGFFNLYEAGGYRRELALEGLGKTFAGAEASVKPYPCAREHHGAIAAALALHARGARGAGQETVRVTLPPNAHSLSGKPLPPDRDPTVGAAIGSAAYGVAVALLQGRVGIGDFEAQAVARPEVLALARRIEVRVDPAAADARTLVPQSVELRAGGEVRSETCHAMPGSPQAPLSTAQEAAKLADCVAHAASPTDAARVRAAVQGLEALPDVRNLRLG